MNGALDQFSQKFAELLFARQPQWRQFVQETASEHVSSHLRLIVGRPVAADRVGGLTIDTRDGEITLECGRHWHGHWSPIQTGEDDEDDALRRAMAFIDSVVAEEVVMVLALSDRRPLGGRVVDADAARDIVARGQAAFTFAPKGTDRLDLWSWQGTYDAVLPPYP